MFLYGSLYRIVAKSARLYCSGGATWWAPHAVLFVIFAILWRGKHVHSFFPLHYTCWDSTWEVQMDVKISVCCALWILRQKQQQHTHRAQHSTGLPLTSLWDSPRSRPPEVGPGCVRVPTHNVCVCLSLAVLQRRCCSHQNTHTKLKVLSVAQQHSILQVHNNN